ncbi:MAG: flavin reductase family protein [Methanoregulaceae archaeon]|nr:flavin reductase family protein [Methanoregulaceae archaeon]
MEKVQLGPMPYMSVMPTLLVGANVHGKPNYMVAAWATVACLSPPMVCVAINHARHTAKGIDENGNFSLNVPSASQAVETDHCGITSGASVDKSKVFRSFYGKTGNAPMPEECPVNIECKVFRTVDCGSHVLYIGEIVEIFAAGECITDGKPDPAKVNPMVYTMAMYWKVGDPVGKAFSIGGKYRK